MYLGCFAEDFVTDDVYLLKIILASVKKAITKCWLCNDPPSISLFYFYSGKHQTEGMYDFHPATSWELGKEALEKMAGLYKLWQHS